MSRHNYVEVIVMNEKLIIKKKALKGEDGYKTFSVRIKEDTVKRIEEIANETSRSRNELINIKLVKEHKDSSVIETLSEYSNIVYDYPTTLEEMMKAPCLR